MADAIAAFKEAFNSYKQNAVDYCIYSLLMGAANGILALAILAAFVILGVLSAGSALSIAGSSGGFSLAAVGVLAVLVIVAVGFVIFLWLEAGLTGAYLETLNMLATGRKQSFGGFFKLVPKRATAILGIWIVMGLCIGVPLLGALLLSPALGQLGFIVLLLVSVFIALVVLLLFFFAMPAAVLDGRGMMAAIGSSVSASGRNIVAIILYVIVSGIISLPGIVLMFIGIGSLYLLLFYMPLAQLAMLLLYKKK
jgi:hypothetical protein